MSAPAPGTTLAGKFLVERVLGEGGMGCVVAARHIELNQRVALKFLHGELARNGEVVARFLREGQAAAQIQNEHVARVTDVGRLEDGSPYLVLEYLEGNDLAHAIRDRGALPPDEAIDYLLQACEAIAEAHALGIVHRDLKPANIFLTHRRDGTTCAKVLDFGISKVSTTDAQSLTRTHGIMGSPLYMSPEQLRSARDVDARTDLWALGVTLFELLAGSQPFTADDVPALTLKIALEPPRALRAIRPELSPELEAVVMRCLEKDPERRYRTVADLAMALRPFAPEHAQASIARIARTLGVSVVAPTLLATQPMTVPATMPGGGTTAPSIRDVIEPPRRSALPWIALALLLGIGAGAWFFVAQRRVPEPTPAVRITTPVIPEVSSSPSKPTTAPIAPASVAAPSASPTPSTLPPPVKPKPGKLAPTVVLPSALPSMPSIVLPKPSAAPTGGGFDKQYD